jgi:hypothetical protein
MFQKSIFPAPPNPTLLQEAARIAQVNRARLEAIAAAQQSQLMLGQPAEPPKPIEIDSSWRNDATGYSYGE